MRNRIVPGHYARRATTITVDCPTGGCNAKAGEPCNWLGPIDQATGKPTRVPRAPLHLARTA
jgi:hypothetical protein